MINCTIYAQENSPLLIRENGKYGYINTKGEVVINPQYDWALDFSEGLAIVMLVRDKNHSTYGIINIKGELVFKLDKGRPNIEGYIDGFLKVDYYDNDEMKSIFYDKLGNISDNTNIRYSRNDSYPYPSGNGSLFGYIDSNNKYIIKPQFIKANRFSDGLASVCRKGEKFGYIDSTGSFVIQPQFLSANEFSEGLAFVTISPDNVLIMGTNNAVINKKGEVVMYADSVLKDIYKENGYSLTNWFTFNDASKFQNGFAKFYDMLYFTGRIRYINKDGKIIW